MKIFLSVILISIFTSLAVLSGCKDTITVQDLDNVVVPDSSVSYSKYIQPIFSVKCANAGCHDEYRAGGLSLLTWAEATSSTRIIFPYDPDQSVLVWTIELRSGFPVMPPVGFPYLTPDQIEGVRTWIKEGALNN
ncbi:MAG: hypothetical protein IPJ03_03045 [Ignavibacteriales bacterium]|nr:hypothetical protein [Ignavibacteriales bacterium]